MSKQTLQNIKNVKIKKLKINLEEWNSRIERESWVKGEKLIGCPYEWNHPFWGGYGLKTIPLYMSLDVIFVCHELY